MKLIRPNTVTITLPLAQAEDWSLSLSDLLCWHAGYASAKNDDHSGNSPMGVYAAREINIKLKTAIEAARK